MNSIATVTLNPAIDRLAYLDDFALDKVNKVKEFSEHAAGKGINVAKALAGFDVFPCVTGLLGSHNALIFRERFDRLHLENAFVKIPGKNRTNIGITSSGGKVTDINFPGFFAQESDVDQVMAHLLEHKYTHVVLAGSLPLGLSPSTYAQMIHRLKQEGVRVLFDSSGPALTQGIAAQPWFIKPNKDELAEIKKISLDNFTDLVAEARRIQQQGIENVVVSLGDDGALFVHSQMAMLVKPPKLSKIVSTVGAGDTLVAGWLLSVLQGKSLEEAARFSVALSAYSVTHDSVGKGRSCEEAILAQFIEATEITYV